MNYMELDDHALNKLTSKRAGKSKTAPYCGDISLAMQLIREYSWIIAHTDSEFKAAVRTPIDFYSATANTLARAVTIAWNMAQDGRNAPW